MRITRRNTPALYSCSCSAANNALRLNKCMRVHGAHLYKAYLREGKSREDEERKERKLSGQSLRPSLSFSLLRSPGSSSIPEIGQKSNRVADVNGNVGGVDPGRRGIQQICSLTSELARSTGLRRENENVDDATRDKIIHLTTC